MARGKENLLPGITGLYISMKLSLLPRLGEGALRSLRRSLHPTLSCDCHSTQTVASWSLPPSSTPPLTVTSCSLASLRIDRTLLIIRDLKIPRFRVRVREGLPVPVLGYTGNQSNFRYTGWHQVPSAQKCEGYIVFRMPSEHRLKLTEKYFSMRFKRLSL